MGGIAFRGTHFCLAKSKQKRVLRKTRRRGGVLKIGLLFDVMHLFDCLLTQTVAQDSENQK